MVSAWMWALFHQAKCSLKTQSSFPVHLYSDESKSGDIWVGEFLLCKYFIHFHRFVQFAERLQTRWVRHWNQPITVKCTLHSIHSSALCSHCIQLCAYIKIPKYTLGFSGEDFSVIFSAGNTITPLDGDNTSFVSQSLKHSLNSFRNTDWIKNETPLLCCSAALILLWLIWSQMSLCLTI